MDESDSLQHPSVATERDLLEFFERVIGYREAHKDKSDEIAQYAFDTSHPNNLPFKMSKGAEKLRFEFGALEAPGTPSGEQTIDDFANELWQRLHKQIQDVKKRTV